MHCTVFLLAICSAVAITLATPGPKITHIEFLPDFQTKAKANNRDCGQSSPILSPGKTQILWIFDDTFTPDGLRSATAGWAFNYLQPNSLFEELDSAGAPLQFYPFTYFELLYNNAQAKAPPCCQNQTGCPDNNHYCHCYPNVDCVQRIAHWSAKPIQVNDTHILLFYYTNKIGWAPFDFRNQGMGLAYSQYPRTTAQRVMVEGSDLYALYVFDSTDPAWNTFIEANGYIYFTYGTGFCGADIYMARVQIANVANKKAYTYYDGSTFSSDFNSRKIIGSFGGGIGSCMWSDYLKKFLTFNLGLCSGTNGAFRTADNPWGPWSDPTVVDLAPYEAKVGSYAGVLHQELSLGNSTVISFFVPADNFSGMIKTRRIYLG